MQAINPRQSPSAVIDQMRGCSRILAESLHGAICADAMGIPWASCILAHRFNEFKWRDWLATIDRPYAPLLMARPLVRSISLTKSMANRVARFIKYKPRTRHPALRPIVASSEQDVLSVSRTLQMFVADEGNFSCSAASRISQQRRLMHIQCERFARDYDLQFNPR